MLTPASLSLITAMYVPPARLAEITPLPRTSHALLFLLFFFFFFFLHFAWTRVLAEVSPAWHRHLVKAAFRPNFVHYTRRLKAPAVCFSQPNTPRSQHLTPDQYNPKLWLRVFPKPVYRVDRRENARYCWCEVAILDSRLAVYLVTVMHPMRRGICCMN